MRFRKITITERCPYCSEELYKGSPKSIIGEPAIIKCPKCSGSINNGLKEWRDLSTGKKLGEIFGTLFGFVFFIIAGSIIVAIIIFIILFSLLKINDDLKSIIASFYIGLPFVFATCLSIFYSFIREITESNKRCNAKTSPAGTDNSSKNKSKIKYPFYLVLAATYFIVYQINPVIDGVSVKESLPSFWTTLTTRITGGDSITKTQIQGRRDRLITDITNDLRPILTEIEKTLQYNDISGILNWLESENYTSAQLVEKIREMQAIKTVNDQNNDNIINCQDFAILFYKLALNAGFDVKITSNTKLNHAFNSVKRIDGTWETIEPQAGSGGRIMMKNAWKNYDPAFDKDTTDDYLNSLFARALK